MNHAQQKIWRGPWWRGNRAGRQYRKAGHAPVLPPPKQNAKRQASPPTSDLPADSGSLPTFMLLGLALALRH